MWFHAAASCLRHQELKQASTSIMCHPASHAQGALFPEDLAKAFSCLPALCPGLQHLSIDHVHAPDKSGGPLETAPIQHLEQLESLNLTLFMREEPEQATLDTLGVLQWLRRLHVNCSYGQFSYLSVAALGQLQDLEELVLDLNQASVFGLTALAVGCPQLTRLRVKAERVVVLEEEGLEQGERGGYASSSHSAACTSGGAATARAVPWWPSLQHIHLALYHMDWEPGELARLHLDQACRLKELFFDEQHCSYFNVNLVCNSPASSPGALHELCEQLAALPAGVRPEDFALSAHR